MKIIRRIAPTVALLFAASVFVSTTVAASTPSTAKSALNKMGDQNNICVVLGLPDSARPDFVTDLAKQSQWRIYFQSPSLKDVTAVRESAEKAGLLGKRIFAHQGGYKSVHLADNLAGAVWVSAVSKTAKKELSEVARVLHPEGVAYLDGVRMFAKAYPKGIQAWDHPYHGPDNNPQSYDELARAPYLTQFIAEPKFSPMPEQTVSAAGVVFKAYGHIAHKENQNDILNTLMGINAYNGTILWRRPNDGYMIHRNTMVATPGTLLLGNHESLQFIDAQTGKTKHKIVIPEGMADGPVWKWMALHNGILYALIGGKETPIVTQRSDNPALGHWPWGMWDGHDYKDEKKNFGFGRTFVAIDIESRKIIKHHKEKEFIDSRGVCMKDGRIYYYSPQKFLACLDLQSEQVRWRNTDGDLLAAIGKNERAQLYKTGYSTSIFLKTTKDHLVFAGPQRPNLVVARTEDGKLLWHKKDGNLQVVLRKDAFFTASRDGIGAKMSYDTGEVLAKMPNRRACTRATGSIDSIFYRTSGGTVRYDTVSNTSQHIAPMRPPCQDGVVISNGLLYWGPWMCGCQLSLYGHIALSPAGDTLKNPSSGPQLELAAEPGRQVASLEARRGDWPSYRGDNARSQTSTVTLPRQVSRAWTFKPESSVMPTAPVTAGGMIFYADRSGAIRALDGGGQLKWKAFTGGPIYYPPAIDKGRLFVGSGDGRVHAFEAATGKPLWRYRVAQGDRLIPVFGKLISTWPVAGGIVVEKDTVYAAAGIAHYDGTHVVALDAATGKPSWENDKSGVLSKQVNSGVSLQGELMLKDGELQFPGGGVYLTARYDIDGGQCLNEPHNGLNSKYRTAFYPYYPEYAEYTSINHTFPNGDTLNYVASYEGSRHTPLTLKAPFTKEDLEKLKKTPAKREGKSDRRTVPAKRKDRWQKEDLRFNGFVRTPKLLLAAGQSGPQSERDKNCFLTVIQLGDGAEVWKKKLSGAAVKDGVAVDHKGRIFVTLRNGEIQCFAPAMTAELKR